MTKDTVRRKAKENGHILGQFKRRTYGSGCGPVYAGRTMYHVAWCRVCGATAFTVAISEVNPAIDHTCKEYQKVDAAVGKALP